MPACRQCSGEGELRSLDDDEAARGIVDVCYHCSGSGVVDADTDLADEVDAMLMAIAWQRAYEWRAAVNSDPEGEGLDFRAAENGVSSYEYLVGRAYAELPAVQARYEAMTPGERDLLLAWDRTLAT